MTCDTATLVLGGARSGKSGYAQMLTENIAHRAGGRPGIVATAQALDDEMVARIERHKADRGTVWLSAEEPLELADALTRLSSQCAVVLVDCLTLWLSNLMHAQRDLAVSTNALKTAVAACACPVVIVSNEVGMGLVPDTPLGRAFRDAQGRLNQEVAQACGQVTFVVAGLPMHLKTRAKP